MTKSVISLLTVILLPLPSIAQLPAIVVTPSITEVPKIDSRYDLSGKIYAFKKMGWLPGISKEKIAAAIQALIDDGLGKSFRYIGVTEDWNHGHFTWDLDVQKVIGVIFHTQEGLLPYFLIDEPDFYAKGNLLEGLDHNERSWIYFFESGALLNLKDYALETRPNSIELRMWNAWIRLGTYRPENIDPKKIGKNLGYEDMSQRDGLHFYKITCPDMSEQEYERSNVLRVLVKKENICLYLVNDFCNAEKLHEDARYCSPLD